jgi:hypothetical protein
LAVNHTGKYHNILPGNIPSTNDDLDPAEEWVVNHTGKYHTPKPTKTPTDNPTPTTTPTPNPGGGWGSGGGSRPPLAGNPGEEPPDDCVRLYRAIGQRECNDLLKYGDYNTSINEGKYFSTTLQGAIDFANDPFNAGRNMTITSIDVPKWAIDLYGDPFYDTGGAGSSVYIPEEYLGDFYKTFRGLPIIIHAPWVPVLP